MNSYKRGPLISKIIIIISIIVLALFFSNMFRFTGFFILTETNESATTGNLSFNAVKNHTIYINIEKTGINVTSAKINLTGQKGLFTGWWFNLNETNTKPAGITMNNTYFWVPDSGNKQVYVYNMSGQYVKNWSIPNTPIDITNNNTNIWISSGGNITYYDMEGTYLDDWIPTNCRLNNLLQLGNRGITSNDTNVFVITDYDSVTLRICTYTQNGTLLRTETGSFLLSTTIMGLYTNTTYFWFPKRTQLHKREQNISIGIEQYSSIFGVEDLTGRGITGNASNLFLVTYNISDDASNPTTAGRVYKSHIDPTYPNKTWLEVGTEDGLHEWNHSGTFNLSNNMTADFSSSINNYLSTCTELAGNCTVPFKFHSDVTGIIDYFGIRVSYNDTQSPTVSLSVSQGPSNVPVGSKVSISCSSSDNIRKAIVTITIGGSELCSSEGSCSGSYTIPDTDDKAVTCEAVDDSGNSASQSLTITTANGGSSGGSSGGGAPGGGGHPSIDIEEKIEEIEETFPLEILPFIEPIEIEDITVEVTEEEVIVNLEDQVELAFSFIDGIRAKPKLDIKFSTKEVPEFEKQIVEIKYINWHYYFNILLFTILIIVITNTMYKRYHRIL